MENEVNQRFQQSKDHNSKNGWAYAVSHSKTPKIIRIGQVVSDILQFAQITKTVRFDYGIEQVRRISLQPV